MLAESPCAAASGTVAPLLPSAILSTTTVIALSWILGFESKQILAGSDDGKINMFDLVRGTKVNTLSVSEDVVHSLSYHPTKEEFACGSKH